MSLDPNIINQSRQLLIELGATFEDHQPKAKNTNGRKFTFFNKIALLLTANGVLGLATAIYGFTFRQSRFAVIGSGIMVATYFTWKAVGHFVLVKSARHSQDKQVKQILEKFNEIVVANEEKHIKTIEDKDLKIKNLSNNNTILFKQGQERPEKINELENTQKVLKKSCENLETAKNSLETKLNLAVNRLQKTMTTTETTTETKNQEDGSKAVISGVDDL